MNELPRGLPPEAFENVRKMEVNYSRRSGEGTCSVEYVGGRMEILEVDRFLLENLLDHLKYVKTGGPS